MFTVASINLSSSVGRRVRIAAAVALTVAAAILDVYTIRTALRRTPLRPAVEYQPVTEVRELGALAASASGRYETGAQPGDRAIEIGPDRHVRFLRISHSGERLDAEDTFSIARQDGKVRLVTARSGVIEVGNIDTVSYFLDVYRRK